MTEIITNYLAYSAFDFNTVMTILLWVLLPLGVLSGVLFGSREYVKNGSVDGLVIAPPAGALIGFWASLVLGAVLTLFHILVPTLLIIVSYAFFLRTKRKKVLFMGRLKGEMEEMK
jgi:ammonia channel protein AmtB